MTDESHKQRQDAIQQCWHVILQQICELIWFTKIQAKHPKTIIWHYYHCLERANLVCMYLEHCHCAYIIFCTNFSKSAHFHTRCQCAFYLTADVVHNNCKAIEHNSVEDGFKFNISNRFFNALDAQISCRSNNCAMLSNHRMCKIKFLLKIPKSAHWSFFVYWFPVVTVGYDW